MLREIAVVGNQGFIGSSLNSRLLESGFNVAGFNSRNPVMSESLELNNSLKNVDVLVWAASKTNPIIAENDPRIIQNELDEWKKFLSLWESERKLNSRLIFLSSGGCVYSSQILPFKENFPTDGINKYGRQKAEMEKMLKRSISNWTILRLSNVYGPGQQSGKGQGVVAEWKKTLQESRSINIFGSLNSFRDYVYIADVVEAIILAMDVKGQNKVFNVGSGARTSLKELLSLFKELAETNFEINHHKSRQSDRDGYYLNTSEFESTFRWVPKISLKEGLRETLNNR